MFSEIWLLCLFGYKKVLVTTIAKHDKEDEKNKVQTKIQESEVENLRRKTQYFSRPDGRTIIALSSVHNKTRVQSPHKRSFIFLPSSNF
jgi:hypothetical protein